MSANSDADSQEAVMPLLLLTLTVPSFISKSKKKGEVEEKILPCVPSWNEILGMEHWARDKRKKDIQAAFLSALRACAADLSTRTTSAKNTWSIAADTLASYQETALARRKLKQLSARQEKKKMSTPLSKSSPSLIHDLVLPEDDAPPF